VVSTPSDVALQDARKAIEMFRQMKVDIVGLVENMSYFVCPHCHQEVDIFSKGGAEKTAAQFGVNFLGNVELDPDIRSAGDSGKPVVLQGEDSPHAKSIYAFAKEVLKRVDEIKASSSQSVIQIQ
jgi:ATP-binding protein involved in chromosome partitioning